MSTGLPATTRRVLALAFFLSGAATLILEVVWAKELSYVLGNTTYAVGTVVGAFMTGLALGSALASRFGGRIRRPLLWYAALEASIALCAIASVPIFRSTGPLFQSIYRALADSNTAHTSFFMVRFLLVVLLMLVPVTAMGMTLPVMVGAFGRNRETYDREAGTLYGLNTLGAVLGTIAAGFVLIPALGLLKTAFAAGTIQATVALIVWTRNRQLRGLPEILTPTAASPAWTRRQLAVASIFLVSGALAMVYEVAWFRLLTLVTGPSAAAFATMLATFLVAVGAGSMAAGRFVERPQRPLYTMGVLEALLGFSVLATLGLYNRLPEIHSALLESTSISHVAPFLVAGIVMAAPCFMMGALFPAAVRALNAAGPDRAAPEQAVGRLYLFNTVGAIAGSLGAAFWLVPRLGMEGSFLGASIASVGLGLALVGLDQGRRFLKTGAALAAGTVAIALLLPSLRAEHLNRGRYLRRGPDQGANDPEKLQLLFHREGVNTAVSVYRSDGHVDLRVAGKVDASNSTDDLRTQLFVGQIPVMLAKDPQRVAIIGYGSGMSAGAALQDPGVKSVDVMEIEQGVLEASVYFNSINGNPMRDPRTRLILEDGRTYLTYTDRRYDVITSEPSNPWIAGVGNLFTTDFYRIARDRLTSGGVFGQWIQLYEISDEAFATMLASLQEVFPYVVLFVPETTDVVAVASMTPIEVPWNVFRDRFERSRIATAYRNLGLRRPADLLAHFGAGAEQTRAISRAAHQRNTDDNTWLERRLASEFIQLRAHMIDLPLRDEIMAQRLAGMQAVFPGLPAAEVAEEVNRYLHDMEPAFDDSNRVGDQWGPYRGPIVLGMAKALRQQGMTEAAARTEELFKQAQVQWRAREEATGKLLEAVSNPAPGQNPMEVVQGVLKRTPGLPAALWLLGDLEARAGQTAEAEAHYRQVLEYPWHKVFYDAGFSLMNLYGRNHRNADAESLARSIAALNPYWMQPYLALAQLRMQAGDQAGAHAMLAEGLKFNPNSRALLDLRSKL